VFYKVSYLKKQEWADRDAVPVHPADHRDCTGETSFVPASLLHSD
jgi:hypothetical protein